MPTTGRLYATTASGWSGAAAATGAPDGNTAAAQSSALVTGGFGVQDAIGSQPTSIDAVRVGVRASAQNNGVLLALATTAPAWSTDVALTKSLADYSAEVSPTPTWAQLASLEASLTRNGAPTQGRYVDAVWVEVDYTMIQTASRAASLQMQAGLNATAVGELLGVPVSAQMPTRVGLTTTASQEQGADARPGLGVGIKATAFRRALTHFTISHPARTLDQLMATGAPRRDRAIVLDGPHVGRPLPIIGGTFTEDRTAEVRLIGSWQISWADWLWDVLHPDKLTEVQLVTQIRDDHHQWIDFAQGVVHATALDIDETPSRINVGVPFADRSDWVKAAGMRHHIAVAGTHTLASGIQRALAERAPWLTVDMPDPGYRSGRDLMIGSPGADPWQACVDLARDGLGLDLHVDVNGQGTATPWRNPAATDPDLFWVEGPQCVLGKVRRQVSTKGIANVFGCPWEEARPVDAASTWTPSGGMSWWVDHTSPTRVEVLGERARVVPGDKTAITSPAQALDIARAYGLSLMGRRETVDAEVRYDPRVKVGMIVRIRRPRLQLDEVFVVEGRTVTWGKSMMTVKLGGRQVIA